MNGQLTKQATDALNKVAEGFDSLPADMKEDPYFGKIIAAVTVAGTLAVFLIAAIEEVADAIRAAKLDQVP